MSTSLALGGCFKSPSTPAPVVSPQQPAPVAVQQPAPPTPAPQPVPQPAQVTAKKATQPHKVKPGKQNCVGYDCTHVWSTYVP